jgi:ATP-dependent DNA ligase
LVAQRTAHGKSVIAIHRPGGANAVGEQATSAEGAVVFAKPCELGLEGIVSKREGSFHKSGRSRNWLKTKNPDFVRDVTPCHVIRSREPMSEGQRFVIIGEPCGRRCGPAV